MRRSVARQLSRSQQEFRDIVWPSVKMCCGGGELIPVEEVADYGFAKTLDTLAGIDAWQLVDDPCVGQALRGIASRVQWTSNAWNTFTVRRSVASGGPTEYDKRLAALNGAGYLYPHLTIQAYIFNGALLSVGVAETRNVLAAVSPSRWRCNPSDGNTFYYVDFETVAGISIVDNTVEVICDADGNGVGVFDWPQDELGGFS